jgi:hypothetical protein
VVDVGGSCFRVWSFGCLRVSWVQGLVREDDDIGVGEWPLAVDGVVLCMCFVW